MPTLSWIGKDKVINHHLDVPFRTLDCQYTFRADTTPGETPTIKPGPAAAPDNLIIHGDNLEALKALLPRYEGRVKCIYIDPPYNTGNEGWVYNDNVNDPKLKRWLAQVVGKEGEDLSRHDKWLCMMYPRLKLLHKLLAEDGAIFISIDDNEQATIRLVLEEIFGSNNFVANIIWQKRTSPDARLNLGPAHDFIIVYAKNKRSMKLNLVPLSSDRAKDYKNPDKDPRGLWASVDLTGQKGHATENQFYEIVTPVGKRLKPPTGRCWAIAENTYLKLAEDNRIWFGKNGTAKPRQKKFLFETEGTTVWTWWNNTEVGHNQEAAKELGVVLGAVSQFDTPKPSRLIERILQLGSSPGDIILDSFAGSGTTAHALLNLNQQDGGNRQFILVEMEDYAESITAERVRRVIQGYADKPGTGGQFSYCTLGQRLFDDNGDLNPAVSLDKIREYIWFTETRLGSPYSAGEEHEPYFLGQHEGTAYYFCYDPAEQTTLDFVLLGTIGQRAEQYIIYADACTLPDEFLQQHNIIFKKIPRDISRL